MRIWLLILILSCSLTVTAKSNNTDINALLVKAHGLYKDDKSGANADYIPALAKVDSELFGIALVTKDGKVYSYGDVDTRFSIQSISKVFTLALALEKQAYQVQT